LKEVLENKRKVEHTLPLDPKLINIRPAFQGSIIRLWLSNGVMHRSSLKRPNIENSRWLKADKDDEDDDLTFAQKYDKLCAYKRDVFFQKGVKNSPFCHIFIMVTPQVTSFSQIDCGRGYLIYLETKECYNPISDNADEEEKSFFLSRIPKEELTPEEVQVGVKRQIDRFVFPLNQTTSEYPMARFIPPPSTDEDLKTIPVISEDDGTVVNLIANPVVYRIGNSSMTFEEAEQYLIRGVSVDLSSTQLEELRKTFPNQVKISERRIRQIQEEFPLGLPGEALYCTCLVGGDVKTYILNPPCSLYRSALVRDPNSRLAQLTLLRNIAMLKPSEPSGKKFYGIQTDLQDAEFEDLCYLHKSKEENGFNYYFGISNYENELPPAPENLLFDPIQTIDGIRPYSREDLLESRNKPRLAERQSYTNSRWAILAYHYILAMTPSKRKWAWESFNSVYKLYTNTLNFMSKNYEDIIDEKSELYTGSPKAFPVASKVKKDVIKRMKDIIEKAKTTAYSTLTEDEPDNLPDDGSSPMTLKAGRQAGGTSYASAAGLPGKELLPSKVSKNIRNLLRKEEAQSLYKMMKVIGSHMKEISKQVVIHA
jgi:hypothetical protein